MKADSSGRKAHKSAQSGICQKHHEPPTFDCNDLGVCVKFISSTDQDIAAELQDADVAFVFAATSSSEGGDRRDLTLGDHDALIERVAAVLGQRTVVVAVTPGALLTPWRERVGAILIPMVPGQEYGNAIVDVLFGAVNPAARLPITFPNAENEVGFTQGMYPGENSVSVYSEALKVGYRWYNSHNVVPAFAFGHGLSFTSYAYSNLKVQGRSITFSVKNSGLRAGSEVPQLYLGFPSLAQEPPRQLKGFQKVHLDSGIEAKITFQVADQDLSIWDTSLHNWVIVSGEFKVMVGASSEDIRLSGTLSNAPAIAI